MVARRLRARCRRFACMLASMRLRFKNTLSHRHAALKASASFAQQATEWNILSGAILSASPRALQSRLLFSVHPPSAPGNVFRAVIIFNSLSRQFKSSKSELNPERSTQSRKRILNIRCEVFFSYWIFLLIFFVPIHNLIWQVAFLFVPLLLGQF